MKEFLPMGSIVLLNNGEKKIMIYGRRQISVTNGEEYDYVACLYPEGNISEDFTYLFNHADIQEVIFTGYADDEETAYLAALREINLQGDAV